VLERGACNLTILLAARSQTASAWLTKPARAAAFVGGEEEPQPTSVAARPSADRSAPRLQILLMRRSSAIFAAAAARLSRKYLRTQSSRAILTKLS
jgi:hypothetical protein